MKNQFKITIVAFFTLIAFQSCEITVVDYPGPRGADGLAFYGIDYESGMPYSYWDDNPAIPENPELGHFYRTNPGTYKFEYFNTEFDFWYGTYEIWVNRGGPGRPHGQQGYHGLDTYLMLVCSAQGCYESRDEFGPTWKQGENGEVIIEGTDGVQNFKITAQKGDLSNYKAQKPKFKAN